MTPFTAALAAALAAASLGTAQAAETGMAPAVLSEPALQSAKALNAAMLAVTHAGTRLVAVGERGTVLLSDDGAKTWRQGKVPVQITLTAVRFVDERTGWAVGHLGVILKSVDGGETWVKQLDGVQAAKRVAAGGDERTKRFAEEGPDKPFFDIDFVDAQHGVAVGAYNLAFATRDGGQHWTPMLDRLPNPKSLHLYGVRMAGGHVYIVGEQGLMLKSADGGNRFTALASPYKGSFFGVLAARSGTLIAYGLRGTALRSPDQGLSWVPIATGVPVSISSAIELDHGELALLAQTGELLRSRDDGRSFTKTAPSGGPLPAAGLAATDGGTLVIASLRGMRRQAAP
ncbi:WD40/YVTN/BNR-like repeat-containing protein [Aquabacterium sp.]|uniref:WD40/YVTN/BNR-like repeat-containing protein n=1 Tax=Aquabacterium sp. TaxID=1872578 RepID=UPI002C857F73|nr:YCF48-related protein [Aquabacterium sp.]HSW04840.1 YCF48-related protein [Aquabacterium sp.]